MLAAWRVFARSSPKSLENPVYTSRFKRKASSNRPRSYVGVALFGLAGLLSVFGPVHGTSRQAFYALIVLKAPICWALKRLFPALMTDAS